MLIHVLSSEAQYEHPQYRRGTLCLSAEGILADVMGLGKTLTLLSAIVHSIDEARAYPFLPRQQSMGEPAQTASPTSATLVVVPSARRSLHG